MSKRSGGSSKKKAKAKAPGQVWTAAEAAASRATADAAFQGRAHTSIAERVLLRGEPQSAGETAAQILCMRLQLDKWWTEHKEGFSTMWRGMTPQERKLLLQVAAPTMPDAPKRPYLEGKLDRDLTVACILLSDMTIAPLIEGDGEALLAIFNERANIAKWHKDGFEWCLDGDVALVEAALKARELPPADKPNAFICVAMEGLPAYDVDARNPKVQEFIQQGYFRPTAVYKHVLNRSRFICLTLCFIADEYLCGYLGASAAPRTSAYLWAGDECRGKTNEELEAMWGSLVDEVRTQLKAEREEARRERARIRRNLKAKEKKKRKKEKRRQQLQQQMDQQQQQEAAAAQTDGDADGLAAAVAEGLKVEDDDDDEEDEDEEEQKQEEDGGPECYLCLEPLAEVFFGPSGDSVTLDCGNGHAYHRRCVGAWHAKCKQKALPVSCPTCRGACTAVKI